MQEVSENGQWAGDMPVPRHAIPRQSPGNTTQSDSFADASESSPVPSSGDFVGSGESRPTRGDTGMGPFAIAKFILIACLLAFVFFTVASDPISDTPIEEVSQVGVEAMGDDTETMDEEDGRAFKRDFGLSANDYEGVVYYAPASNMEATEVLVVKLSDTSQQQELRDAVETRISQQLNTFEGYAPEQAGLMKDAVLDIRGNYVLYAVGPNAPAARSAFAKSL